MALVATYSLTSLHAALDLLQLYGSLRCNKDPNPMNQNLILQQEAGRKRLAKLLGIAPFRVELFILPPDGILIQVDGAPATEEQVEVFSRDVQDLTLKYKKMLS